MRNCACCRMPATIATVLHGEHEGLGVLVGLCRRCHEANGRLPAGVVQKRLNAAARLAAGDTSGRFWTARFPDPGAARLAAGMCGHAQHADEVAQALGWQ